MSFDVAAEAYDSFMGRFSMPLADIFVDWARLPTSGRALDVGCGTGALTAVLAHRFGETEVAGVEPSASFVDATAARFPWADIRHGTAEQLPFDDHLFTATLAQLVVHFMTDAAAGVREMVRVTRPGGVVAACVWDVENDRAPHAVFLAAAHAETGGSLEAPRIGTRRGDLRRLLEGAGCRDVEDGEISVTSGYRGFDEWWASQTLKVGPSAVALAGLDDDGIARVRAATRAHWPDGPFTVTGTAWVARGVAP
ncbi:ubiquinone/menaquinone biosynthesis C-methylase UbiE [Microbacterium terrae]|uniref:Demethylmenaquinone methyltransferase n=1 Tax=Microbacterium terrae TaxID=69369 RepID=A0A0M2H1M5_9MICO|nr:class I SAM-dependent methyltransferase [Microbacterium terrae]KJL37468.1 Demethylmenaquinone methyltransferase [Microbacterium terrae]MBP1076297.1 ubiquinone/menaquinone biosynthesis C-methylase UbiE [Microbacterium terrae]GLJ97119.1 SAM-dependent methyltransferase [Microbacterium terrae]